MLKTLHLLERETIPLRWLGEKTIEINDIIAALALCNIQRIQTIHIIYDILHIIKL